MGADSALSEQDQSKNLAKVLDEAALELDKVELLDMNDSEMAALKKDIYEKAYEAFEKQY